MHLTVEEAKEVLDLAKQSYQNKNFKLDLVVKPNKEPYIQDDLENFAVTPIRERLKKPEFGLFINGWYVYANKVYEGSYEIHIVNPYTGRDHYKIDVYCKDVESMLSRWIDTDLGRPLCYDNALLRVADMAYAWDVPEKDAEDYEMD